MELEEVKERYVALPKLARFGLVLLLGSSFSLYQYIERTPVLEMELQSAKQEAVAAQAKYEKARRSSEKLPALEARLKDIEEQLRLARRYLPDSVEVDEVLHITARLAKEYGVELSSFTPGVPGDESKAGRYREVPMDVELIGTYANVARFFDSLLHLEQVIHIRNITMSAEEEDNNATDRTSQTAATIRVGATLVLFISSSANSF